MLFFLVSAVAAITACQPCAHAAYVHPNRPRLPRDNRAGCRVRTRSPGVLIGAVKSPRRCRAHENVDVGDVCKVSAIVCVCVRPTKGCERVLRCTRTHLSNSPARPAEHAFKLFVHKFTYAQPQEVNERTAAWSTACCWVNNKTENRCAHARMLTPAMTSALRAVSKCARFYTIIYLFLYLCINNVWCGHGGVTVVFFVRVGPFGYRRCNNWNIKYVDRIEYLVCWWEMRPELEDIESDCTLTTATIFQRLAISN